jgi:hypothetical protein
MCESVPLVWKFTATSVPASTLPLPETVDWTTPFSAVTTCVDVRAELVGGPISVTARTAMVTASTARTYKYQGLLNLLLMGGPSDVSLSVTSPQWMTPCHHCAAPC